MKTQQSITGKFIQFHERGRTIHLKRLEKFRDPSFKVGNTMKALKRKNATESNRNQKTLKDDVFENLLVGAFVISSILIIALLLIA